MLHSALSRYYILVGDAETWDIALRNNLWGFSEKAKGSWNKCEIGDYVGYYVTAPVKKIIGFGRIKYKFIDDSRLFPDELIFHKALWRHRIALETFYVNVNWYDGIPVSSRIMLNTGRKVIDKEYFMSLVMEAEDRWSVKLRPKISHPIQS